MEFTKLGNLLKAGCFCAAVEAPLIERSRVRRLLSQVASELSVPCYFWNLGSPYFQGIDGIDKNLGAPSDLFSSVLEMLDWVKTVDKPGLFVVENIQSLIDESTNDWLSKERGGQIVSRIANIIESFEEPGGSKYLLLLSTEERALPTFLQAFIPEVWMPLPGRDEILEFLNEFLPKLLRESELAAVNVEEMIGSVSGLSLAEIERALKFWRMGVFNESELGRSLLEYKIGKFREFGLDFKGQPVIEEIGGLDRLKAVLEEVNFEFSSVARRFKIPLPKGWLLVGPPGTGKTFAASVCAFKLKVPLISVDVGALMDGGISYLKKLLRRVEACGRTVLYFDEFDKLFSTSSQPGDGGNSRQILGLLLTWLQDKESETFVIATLNRLDALPPELTRAGRFDEIFYVGFPQAIERKQIIELHASRFDVRYQQVEKSPLTEKDWKILLAKTLNCTGAELSRIVERAARKKASELSQSNQSGESIKLELSDFLEQRALITPLYVRDTDRILAMENSARYIAQPASEPDVSVYALPITSFWGENISENKKADKN